MNTHQSKERQAVTLTHPFVRKQLITCQMCCRKIRVSFVYYKHKIYNMSKSIQSYFFIFCIWHSDRFVFLFSLCKFLHDKWYNYMLIIETRKVFQFFFVCRFVLISASFVALVLISFNFFPPSKLTKPLSGRCNESRKTIHKTKQWGQFNLGFKEKYDRNWHCIKIIVKETSTCK